MRIHYPPQAKNGEGRAELFPARWKVGSRGSAASLLAAAAPTGAQALRRIINDVAMDVMYYTSPIYGQEVNTVKYQFKFTMNSFLIHILFLIRFKMICEES